MCSPVHCASNSQRGRAISILCSSGQHTWFANRQWSGLHLGSFPVLTVASLEERGFHLRLLHFLRLPHGIRNGDPEAQ